MPHRSVIQRRSYASLAHFFAFEALVAAVDLVLFFRYPQNSYHGCVSLILAKLYSNSLLVVFNSQIRIHGARNWERREGTAYNEESMSSQTTAWTGVSGAEGSDHTGNSSTVGIAMTPRGAVRALNNAKGNMEVWDETIDLNHKVSTSFLHILFRIWSNTYMELGTETHGFSSAIIL